MVDSDKRDSQIDLLSLPYRDRQLIAVVQQGESAIEQVEIKLDDYIGIGAYRRNLNPKNWLRKDYWTDTRSWGLFGYLVDRVHGGKKISDKDSIRYLRKIQADLAERIFSFPPGHPLYDTAYAGHPLKPSVYIPLANFHRFLFEEKFNDLLTLLWCLSATKVTINYVRGYRDAFDSSIGLTMPIELPVQAGASFERKASYLSEATLEAYFTPVGEPHVPESTVWYDYEPTWKKIAEARLSAGLRAIDVELRYDDDFGVGGEIAIKLSEIGFKLGGEFQKHERTVWKFHSSFE